ncbi:hypothetical protein ACHAWX_000313 [Stephanocyclus meneghinianus]
MTASLFPPRPLLASTSLGELKCEAVLRNLKMGRLHEEDLILLCRRLWMSVDRIASKRMRAV